MTKISVIIPVYNVEKYLNKCLDSILNQTLNDIEVICIDDGSTDNSPKILADYAKKDARIKIITNSNQGPSAARNKGMDIASGEYISFIDSDDWVDANFLEILYTEATNNNADIAVCSIVKAKENKNKIRYKFKISKTKIGQTPQEKYKLCGLPDNCYVWNKIYKKEILKDVKFELGMYYEDIEFSHKAVYASNKLITVPNIKYYYFQNPNSIVAALSNKKVNDFIVAMQRTLAFLEYHHIPYDINQYYAPYYKEVKIFGIRIFSIKKWQESMIILLGKRIKLIEIKTSNLINYNI